MELGLSADEDGVELTISDDGRGFDPRTERGSLGLTGMSERARLLGGRLHVDSRPGDGTRLKLEVP